MLLSKAFGERLLSDLYQGKDPRNIGTYSTAEAVHYLRVPYSTMRSWVFGARYKTKLGSQGYFILKSCLSVLKPKEHNL